ncbi:MAG: Na/Pi cotransporter family protein [Atopobiaceae bacterium]|nr:Na/Pi cotransporter family protein [Atopobiaceae bacterium]
MTTIQIATSILTLFAGIGVFLVACSMMSKNLEILGSGKLRGLFSSASKSKVLGVGIGAFTAAAIQSSGATTVIAIGFLNAGVMSLIQAATIIFGANIGTTITGQIVAWGISGGDSLSTTVIFSALAGLGAFITTFAKSDKIKTIGGIVTGFGMIFVGLEMMSGAMESFADFEPVRMFLASIDNVFLLVVIGAVLTAIIESSSVMTSVAIAMIVAGLITFNQGIYLTMGSNIGACIVSLLAGMGGSTNARRAPVINLTLNIGGALIFLAIGIVIDMVTGGSIGLGTPFEALFPGAPQIQLAMFHTVYNVLKVAIALPLTEAIVALACKIVPDTEEAPTEEYVPHTRFIDDNMLVTPAIAVEQTKNEIVAMAQTALTNFKSSISCARTLDFSERDAFNRNEDDLNHINQELSTFISKLFGEQLSEPDRQYLSHALHSISDLERIGDYSCHIYDYATQLAKDNSSFSEEACHELELLEGQVDQLFETVMRAYVTGDKKAVKKSDAINKTINRLGTEMSLNHVSRISSGACTPEVGAHYLALVSDAERVGGHLFNLAKTVR